MKVCVMMSTYNGEKYLEEQIDSIYLQTGVEVDLYIRDDGSKDKTVGVIQRLRKRFPDIHLEVGDNVGYAKSFFSLLCSVPESYNYYAFSDQDDVWKPNKLNDAITRLAKTKGPALYSCNLELVDEKLNTIGPMEPPSEDDFKKGRYLIDRYSYGCTMVFNSELRKLAINHLPKLNVSHDNWLGLIAVFCGKYVFDEQANILYRQHGNNVTGGKTGIIESWKRRIKNINRIKDESKSSLAEELIINFGNTFDLETMDLLEMVANYKKSFKNKMKFFFDKRTVRRSKEKNIVFRLMIVLSMA